MRTIVLCKVGDQLFGIEKEKIAAIASTNNKKIRTVEQDGQRHVLLSKGRSSRIYDLSELFSIEPAKNHDSQFFLLDIEGQLLTLKVSEKGGLATVPSDALGELPPIFPREIRTLFPETLLNGSDVILLLSPLALAATF